MFDGFFINRVQYNSYDYFYRNTSLQVKKYDSFTNKRYLFYLSALANQFKLIVLNIFFAMGLFSVRLWILRCGRDCF